jgi:hypothetical protein
LVFILFFIFIYPCAIHLHFVVSVFQKKPISKRVDATVIVGSVAAPSSKLAPHAIVTGVPVSVILILNVSPSTGVPDRLVVNEVILADCEVMCTTS